MDHDQVGGVRRSSNACMELMDDYVYARQLVQAYFAMLTVGCNRDGCTNENCCSNPQTPVLSATEAAIKSVFFATQVPVPLCVDLSQEQALDATPASSQLLSFTNPQREELELAVEKLQAVEENHTEDASTPKEDDQQNNHEVHPETPEIEVPNSQQVETIGSEEDHRNREELHPETTEAEVKIQQPESISTDITATLEVPARNSTPRRRLAVAVTLDNGLNKNLESPVKRPTIITRVVVQPKHKLVIDPAKSFMNGATVATDEKEVTVVHGAEVMSTPTQQQELATKKPATPTQDARQRRLSRPKEKLFDAIKRSFSRTKKAPMGSA
ncbi:unnamed protein product [Phytophthora fragariaefolia]|uniref:Unnamed protein product n=1 Tax=Phytophthora fragariaefolia TaxID=1490495 RepID=A0A9W6WXJ2_9STRA|nr:unnamed protein product [Phytophthora fragariaefolia]